MFGVQKQHSSNILAGPYNVLQELPALGPVQVVLGFLRAVPYGLREVLLCCLELPEGHAQGCHELPGKVAATSYQGVEGKLGASTPGLLFSPTSVSHTLDGPDS